MKQYFIALDTQSGDQINGNQSGIRWKLERALPAGSKLCLYQFNLYATNITTGLGPEELNGMLLTSSNLGPYNKSYIAKTTGAKPLQGCVLACIPNNEIYNADSTERSVITYEPQNLFEVELDKHQDIYELELQLKAPNGFIDIDLDSGSTWSVLLKVEVKDDKQY
jgi:hypothetical protein